MWFLIWVNTNMDNLATQTQERPVFGPPPKTAEPVLDPKNLVRTKHLMAPGLYSRFHAVPKGLRLLTKPQQQDIMMILALGTWLVECDGLEPFKMTAPSHMVIPADKQIRISALEHSAWYTMYPTQETDIEVCKTF